MAADVIHPAFAVTTAINYHEAQLAEIERIEAAAQAMTVRASQNADDAVVECAAKILEWAGNMRTSHREAINRARRRALRAVPTSHGGDAS